MRPTLSSPRRLRISLRSCPRDHGTAVTWWCSPSSLNAAPVRSWRAARARRTAAPRHRGRSRSAARGAGGGGRGAARQVPRCDRRRAATHPATQPPSHGAHQTHVQTHSHLLPGPPCTGTPRRRAGAHTTPWWPCVGCSRVLILAAACGGYAGTRAAVSVVDAGSGCDMPSESPSAPRAGPSVPASLWPAASPLPCTAGIAGGNSAFCCCVL